MDGNIATMLNVMARGAQDAGAEVKTYTLFKMKFMACQSCFKCRIGTGACAINDEITAALEDVKSADAVVIGSPIYMMQMTGPVKNLYDRFFPLMDTNYQPRYGIKKMAHRVFAGHGRSARLRLLFRIHGGHVSVLRIRLHGQYGLHQRQRSRECRSQCGIEDPGLRTG